MMMSKHAKRWLSVALACTMLVACLVSGLVMPAAAASIFSEDVPFTAKPYQGAEEITNAIGTYNPNEDALAKALGDKFVTEATQNLIGDFKQAGDKMVHVSSFTIIGGTVYMTYYANTETAGEAPEFLEARLAYCPINNPSQMTILTVQGAGDLIEGQEVKEVYDTILMHKDNDEIYVMWTAMTSQYYRFYAVFDVATKTLGPVRVNRLKFGDIENDFSSSGIRSCFINNGYATKSMYTADIGIMQKLSSRVENGEVWYYTGAYCWQFNCIIKSKDLITWEVVSVPDFGNRSEYENATYVIDDKVYYFVRQFDGTNATKDPYGFLTYYDLKTGEWADPLLINDCQSRSDFFVYGGELYLVHAPNNRNGIGITRIDRDNLANSKAVLVANFPALSGGAFFYPYAKVYGDELYISYTVTRTKICLTKVNLANYLPEAASKDIIKNGDFEDGATNGWESSAAYIKPGVGFNGTTGIHFDFQGWSRVNYTSAADWELDPNSTYRITYRAKGEPLCLYFGTRVDVSGPSVSTGSKVLDGQWCTRVVYFTTGAEPSIKNLYFGRTNGNTVGDSYVDDIVVEKVTKDLDRIVGGDMNDDSIMFLNATGSLLQYTDDPVPGGNHGRVMTFTKDGYGALNLLRFTKGRVFKFSFDHYGAPFGYDIGSIVDIDYKGWQATRTDDGWTHYEYVFATFGLDGVENSADASMYSFYISGEPGTYIDNVSLMQQPCVENILLSATELSLRPGKKTQLTYTLDPAGMDLQGGELVWKSSNTDAVTVDQNGNIQAVGKAGTSAVITLSNQCLSVSCTVTVPDEDKVVTAFMKDTGIGSYSVTDHNYDAIIGAEQRWNALTDAQRAHINELLPNGRQYADLLATAKAKQAMLAEEFVRHYAFTDEGAIRSATFNNCLWIATAEDEWTAMSDATKAVVNNIATTLCGVTFEKLYTDAKALIPVTDPDNLPGGTVTDEAANAGNAMGMMSGTVGKTESRILMVLAGVLVLAAAVAIVLVARKRRAVLRVLAIVLTLCLSLGFICVVPIDVNAWSLTGNWLDLDAVPPITDYAYSIAVVGDTQVITDQAPDKLAGIYDWILANKDKKNIGFVAGLGDITETNSVAQWQVARDAIMRLQGKIPFSIVEGNHDNGNGSTANMNTAFPVSDVFKGYADGTWGVYEQGKIDNSYQLFEIAGIKYMMIALEFGPSPDILEWAGELCDRYPERNVIITTHAYLDGDANIMDENSSGSPHLKGGYPTTYGTTIWNDLITTHDNIVLAMSGHVSADNFKVKQEVGKYGQIVTNLMSNPQTIDAQLKHSGMVTMLYFSADGTTMTVQDYSTIQNQFYGEAVTVTVDKAQHRHKASTDVFSSDAETHWYACECGGKAEEAPHAWTAWEGDGAEQTRSCVFCGYTEDVTLGEIFVRTDLHRAAYREWQKDADYHWLTCDCDSEIHKDFHNWTQWKKTGTASSVQQSIFSDDVPFTSTPYDAAVSITGEAGVINPNDDTLAAELGDTLAAEIKANIIADFEQDGDQMVHVSSFTIVDGIVYMTYYANTATAGEDSSHLEARFAYCPLSNPSDITTLTVQKVGDTLEGRAITKVYDTILMNKNDGKIYVMWTAATTQYYRFYTIFDIETKTMGDIKVNRFKVGDVVNDMSISGIRSALINNGYSTKWMGSDIGIMQKLSARVENGEVWYYTGMYCWQFTCIIKSKDLITWEYVAAPDFGNRSEYENATFVLGDRVYYFVRQFDGTNAEKDPYGFLTYYDLNNKTWATPVLVNDCQSRGDFFHYGGELYLVHAPKNRNGIGILRVDQQNLANSDVVAVADMGTLSGGSCFYPYVMVYGDTAYISYTVLRQHIRLAKFDLTNYAQKTGDSIVLPQGDANVGGDDGETEEAEHDMDVWERFCPCGASEKQTLPMGSPIEADREQNLILGQVAPFAMACSSADITHTVKGDFKAGNRYVLRVTTRNADGKITFLGNTLDVSKTDAWRVYQHFFTPDTDLKTLDLVFHHNGATVNTMMVTNLQILEAPTDGTFNLVAGSNLDVETNFFAFDGDGGDGPYASGNGYHTADPADPTNTVLRLNNNTSNIFVLNHSFPGYTLPKDKMIEVTFRRTGANVIFRQEWSKTYECYNNSATAGTAANEWLTYTFYVDPADFNDGKEWMNLSVNMYYGKGPYADKEAYIDDIVIREIPHVESISFKDGVAKVQANTTAQDLMDQLVITPPNGLPTDIKNMSWSIADNKTNKYNSATGKFDGAEMTALTLTGTTVKIANLGADGGLNSLWSLANVKPTITVTNGAGLTVTAPVEWVYPETVFDIDVDTFAPGRNDTFEVVDPTDATNKVMQFPTSKDFTDYFTVDTLFLKPNTRYLLTYRSKAKEGDNGRIYAYLTCSNDVLLYNSTKRPTLNSDKSTSEWVTNSTLVQTGAQPAMDRLYSLMFQRYGAGTTDVLVDDVKLVMVPDDSSVVIGGDFEYKAPTIAYYDRVIRNGLGTIVKDGDNAVLKLNPKIERGTSTAIWGLDYLKKNTAYKVTFRHKGGPFQFHVAGGDGWASTIINVGNSQTYAACDDWKEESFYFATGETITNSGNWSSVIQLGTKDSTEPTYLDDIAFVEVTAPFVEAVSSAAARGGSITLTGGGGTGKMLTGVKPGDRVKVTLKPSAGYLPDPSQIFYTDYAGAVHPILWNPTPMENGKSGGTGMVFYFNMPEDCVSVDAKFVSTAENKYQWGTLATAIHTDAQTGKVDGMRFLNRLYIEGLDWSQDDLFITRGGVRYYVQELGAIARKSGSSEPLTLSTRTKRGVAYRKGSPYVSVTDYTDTYLDFTVILLGDGSEEFLNTAYDCCAYMTLVAVDDPTQTVTLYTAAMTDTAAATAQRTAAVLSR